MLNALPKSVTVLGSTGSIGVSTLALIEELNALEPKYRIDVLCGGKNIELLAQQARKFRPGLTVIADTESWDAFQGLMEGSGLEIACGDAAVIEAAARPVDWVMAAIVGIAGLEPVWAASGTGATVALANKEALVCCGPALLARAKAAGGCILPVDSEHNAIFQVLDGTQKDMVNRLVLTASGGPFRGYSRDQLSRVTVEQALKHPNWSMGAKITIDSASLANKGLEFIEAAYLFDMPADQIDAVIHPQSVIHSMVEYKDGSSLAQMGPADMRVPISYCLNWPRRTAWQAPGFDLKTIGSLTFEAPDEDAFPMLRLAREALKAGGDMPVVFNAANEVCVAAFLQKRLAFTQIAENVEAAMMRAQLPSKAINDTSQDVGTILELDARIRALVGGFCDRSASSVPKLRA
ncbi:1-deoxy-D-xylulose-5-phosphate reductoisomerase [Asticcacaulis endophyticus]|uniref:1-deoxy-D-xylulose 5-phosphate reductoisomerase n=1 Tax=Asticcacaulis endophyticus TaxID=1395890 RepID=A0A918Q7Z9_9CAUL|nr:1-deoxy-D-xylulose-5-phosphate reductoisomerase [Asticcacaulis endophyticus]GGZ37328.1 1-deoxy-D-xylulose 5-phosphate reductoisomerase [Asticcacaulis endophyticus]